MSESGILPEHQAPEATNTGPAEYSPSAEDRRTIKLVNQIFEKNKKARKKFDSNWLDDYKMFRGKQWKEARPSYRHSEVINLIFKSIQGQVPILTDSRPKFEFLPQEPGDAELSEILNHVATYDWERNNWQMVLTEIIYDAHLYSTGIGYMGFNQALCDGAGDIVYESGDPFYAYPDANARQVNDGRQRSRTFVYAEPIDVTVLKREYPDKAQYIKSDLVDLSQSNKYETANDRIQHIVDTPTVQEGGSSYDLGNKDQALKITCYLYSEDFDEEEKKKLGEDGLETSEYEQKLKYPNGRKVCMANGVILSDGPIPYDDGLFPYAKLVNYMDPRSFWGISDIEQTKSPQKIFNKLVSFALDVLTLMGNPIWKVGTGSGVDTDNLFNRPGLIVEADDIDQVKREEGVQLQPYVLQMIDRMEGWFEGISGNRDVSEGVNPTGVTAASAIADLKESAQTRLRLKSRFIDACLQDTGQLYLSRLFQFRTSPQIIRVTANPAAVKYFKFYIEHYEDEYGEAKKRAVTRDYNQDPVTGRWAESIEAKQYEIRAGFDVRVATGSALGFAKAQKLDKASLLFDKGAIDEPELLKAADWPNWEAVWARVEEKRAMKAQAEADAQMAAQGPPPENGARPA